MTNNEKNTCKSVVRQFKTYGDEFHLLKDGSIFILNNKTKTLYTTGSYQTKKVTSVKEEYLDDYCIQTNHSFNLTNNISFRIDKLDTLISSKVSKLKLLSKANIVLAFTLTKSLVDVIHSSCKYYNSTHIQFETNNNNVLIRLFDFRSYLRQEFNCGYAEYVIKEVHNEQPVNFTLRQLSFDKLLEKDYEVSFYDNDIIEFESIEDDIKFYYRKQDTRLPVIEFDHSLTNKRISLLLQPKLI